MRPIFSVLIGGAIGSAFRLLLDQAFAKPDVTFPVSTLIVNVVGSFVLAVLISRVWPHAAPWVRAGLGAGLLGGFTTFSAVMVSMVTLGGTAHLLLAMGYLVVTLVLGFGAAALGLRFAPRRVPPADEVNE